MLEGKKCLIVGIANDQSIAWGCARAFRALGAEIAVTYLNDKARRFVEPLAEEIEAPICMPLDVSRPGQLEPVFEHIGETWGELDHVIHSVAFALRDTLAVPRQHSSDGKQKLGKTSKMGQRDIRRLLVIGATVVIRWASRRGAPKGSWLARVLERKPIPIVAVALANKMARGMWATLSRDEEYHGPILIGA